MLAGAAAVGILALAGCGKPVDVSGRWEGSLDLSKLPQAARQGRTSLRIVFNITKSGDKLTGTTDSPDQGASNIAIDTVTLKDKTLSLSIGSLNASFEGALNSEGNQIDGQFKQGPLAFTLALKKSSSP